jgi:hypothetical protein
MNIEFSVLKKTCEHDVIVVFYLLKETGIQSVGMKIMIKKKQNYQPIMYLIPHQYTPFTFNCVSSMEHR